MKRFVAQDFYSGRPLNVSCLAASLDVALWRIKNCGTEKTEARADARSLVAKLRGAIVNQQHRRAA